MMSFYSYRCVHCLRPVLLVAGDTMSCPDHPDCGVEQYNPQPDEE